MADMNVQIIKEFRAAGGRVGGMFEGADLLLLTTVGARSGELRTTPLGYGRDADRLVVYASNAGGDRHPDWYRNLLATPRAQVELPDGDGGIRSLAARAEALAEGPERDRLYARQAARIPAYGSYETMTRRIIPVVVLHPLDLTVPDAGRNAAIARQLTDVHADLRAQIAALRAGGPTPAAELALHCLSFCEALGAHHAAEEVVLPAFDAAFPHLAPVLARLRREHREVARGLEELRAMIAAGDSGVADRLEALSAEAERHFVYEEEHLLPALRTP
jgi:deazaflavin-dependent oxidoreductase (nitroreductase family)